MYGCYGRSEAIFTPTATEPTRTLADTERTLLSKQTTTSTSITKPAFTPTTAPVPRDVVERPDGSVQVPGGAAVQPMPEPAGYAVGINWWNVAKAALLAGAAYKLWTR